MTGKKDFSAIYVIWLREIIRFWRDKARIITSLIQPAVWLFIVGRGLGSTFRGPVPGVDYMKFMFPGVIGMTVLFTSISSAVSIVWDREFGFLKEVLVAPVSRTAIVLGKALSGSTVAVLQGAMILLLAPLIGVALTPRSVLAALGLMFLLSFALSSTGILVAARMESMQGFQLIMNFVVMPMYFLSGAIFPLSSLPPWMKALARVDPLAYGVDGLKNVIIGVHEFSLVTDVAVILAMAAVMITGAVLLFNSEG
ncbi:MAG: ABC transporter permease [Bacillota bacterium]|nr:ABC transporter permease [Bacillota bacterium]